MASSGGQLSGADRMRRKNKRTSIGRSKNSRPKHKTKKYNPNTKSCNR